MIRPFQRTRPLVQGTSTHPANPTVRYQHTHKIPNQTTNTQRPFLLPPSRLLNQPTTEPQSSLRLPIFLRQLVFTRLTQHNNTRHLPILPAPFHPCMRTALLHQYSPVIVHIACELILVPLRIQPPILGRTLVAPLRHCKQASQCAIILTAIVPTEPLRSRPMGRR